LLTFLGVTKILSRKDDWAKDSDSWTERFSVATPETTGSFSVSLITAISRGGFSTTDEEACSFGWTTGRGFGAGVLIGAVWATFASGRPKN